MVFPSTVVAAVPIAPLIVKFVRVLAAMTVAPLCITVSLNVFIPAKVCVPVFTRPRDSTHASGILKV